MTEPPIQRQVVHFTFYKVDPAWRRLPTAEKNRGKAEFAEIYQSFSKKLILIPYSLIGLRGEVDFLLWRIGLELETLQEMVAQLNQTQLGSYLNSPYSYLATTKRSMYIDKHLHDGQEGRRGVIRPGLSKYLFVYPFIKSREWYQLPFPERQKMMDAHITMGHKYPSIKINTTYSFGIDDQEFVVAFEGEDPREFVDLVQELREAATSKYTVRDTPAFTCVRKETVQEVLDLL